MSELVVMPSSHAGVCEHVTKMGRLSGKGTMSTDAAVPQFRRLPIHVQRVTKSVPPPASSRSPVREEVLPAVVKIMPTSEHGRSNDSSRAPYVEMKLGRNMRAAPKGSLAAKHTQSSINSQQLDSEPLLRSQPNPPNNIVEYYTNTHCAQPVQAYGTTITSHQYPTRSITSPQHPSQDLIEMLNRNNQTVLSQEPPILEQKLSVSSAADRQERLEAELRRMREMENSHLNERDEPLVNIETERVSHVDTPRSPQEETIPKEAYTENADPNMAPPPPMTSLYGSYRAQEDYMPQTKPSDAGSTQPFSPQVTESYSQRNTTAESTVRGYTVADQHDGTYKHITVEKQETVEEVEEIAEDIEVAADSDNEQRVKDDDLDF